MTIIVPKLLPRTQHIEAWFLHSHLQKKKKKKIGSLWLHVAYYACYYLEYRINHAGHEDVTKQHTKQHTTTLVR